jgi:hypothetical protein
MTVMGMAASQARLLCITARIHDVEYQAQTIQNAKMQLANLSDKAYQDYNAALDATTLTISTINTENGEKSSVPATFNNLCSRNKLTIANGKDYAIRNREGLLLVEDDIEEGYDAFKTKKMDDPFQFAMYMCGIEELPNGLNKEGVNNAEKSVYESLPGSESKEKLTKLYNSLLKLTGSDNIYEREKVAEKDLEEYDDTLAKFRKELYKNNSEKILETYLQNEKGDSNFALDDLDTTYFDYYVSIYNQIEQCGGCASIEEYAGDPANDSEWLQNMIQSGQFTIELVEQDRNTGDVDMSSTSPSSDTFLSLTPTTTIDKRALAKAEAEYEHTLKQIDKKDKMFDLELSKLETERSALTTEYDSVKKVIEDNIDRTFGIFS